MLKKKKLAAQFVLRKGRAIGITCKELVMPISPEHVFANHVGHKLHFVRNLTLISESNRSDAGSEEAESRRRHGPSFGQEISKRGGSV